MPRYDADNEPGSLTFIRAVATPPDSPMRETVVFEARTSRLAAQLAYELREQGISVTLLDEAPAAARLAGFVTTRSFRVPLAQAGQALAVLQAINADIARDGMPVCRDPAGRLLVVDHDGMEVRVVPEALRRHPHRVAVWEAVPGTLEALERHTNLTAIQPAMAAQVRQEIAGRLAQGRAGAAGIEAREGMVATDAPRRIGAPS